MQHLKHKLPDFFDSYNMEGLIEKFDQISWCTRVQAAVTIELDFDIRVSLLLVYVQSQGDERAVNLDGVSVA